MHYKRTMLANAWSNSSTVNSPYNGLVLLASSTVIIYKCMCTITHRLDSYQCTLAAVIATPYPVNSVSPSWNAVLLQHSW